MIEHDDRFDDEAREQRELDHQHECHMRDIEQGVAQLGGEDGE